MQRFGHASAERLISGSGLALMYEGLAEVRGQRVDPLSAADVSGHALSGGESLCADVVNLFCAMLGTVAANRRGARALEGDAWPGALDLKA